MKKLGKYILSFCIGVLLILGVTYSPTSVSFADESPKQSLSTIYPSNISHYLNLNDVKDFCVVGDDIFFITKGKQIDAEYYYSFVKYNFTQNQKQVIVDGNTRSINGAINSFQYMDYANNMIMLRYGIQTTIYDTNTCERIGNIEQFGNNPTHSTLADFGNGKTAYASIYQKNSTSYLGVAIFDGKDNLKNGSYLAIGEYDLSTLSIDSNSISNLVLNGNNAFIVNGDDIYPFSIEQNDTTLSPSCHEKKTIADFDKDTCSLRAFTYEDETYIARSTAKAISLFDKDINNTPSTTLRSNNDANNIIFVSNDVLYYYNSNDCNIEAYTITMSQDNKLSLSDSTTLLMGKGSEVGRFDNVSDIAMKCNEYVFVSDRANNRIQVIYQDRSVKVIELKEGSTNYYATSIMLSSDNSLYFIRTDSIQTSLCKVNIFTEEEPAVVKVVDLPNATYDSTITDGDKIYLLSENTVKVYDTNSNSFDNDINLDFTTNAYSKIDYMDNYVYITVDKTLHKVNVSTPSLKFENEFDDDIADISIPTSDQSIYISFEDKNNIQRYSFDNGALTDCLTNISFGDEYKINVFEVNPQDGTVYAYDENASRIVYFNNDDFTQGYCDFESFQDDALTFEFGYTSIVKYAKVPAQTYIYEYINYKGNHSLFDEDKYVILLDTNKSTSVFSYVLYVQDNNVKLGYVETDSITTYAVTADQNYSLITSYNKTPIYKFPTIIGSYTTGRIEYISTVITAVATYPISIDNTSNTYYIIMTNDGRYGFVASSYVTANVNISQKFNANSTIKIYDYSEYVNVYSDKEKTTIIGKLPNNYRIYVENLDKNEKLTLIKYLDDDNNIVVGYIDTKYIATDGTSPIITTAIILFAVNFVIIIALIVWFVIFKKKQKKDALNEQSKKVENKKKDDKTQSKEIEKQSQNNTDNQESTSDENLEN